MPSSPTLPQELEEKLSEIEKERIEQQAKDLAEANKLSYINIAINPIELEALALISEDDSRAGRIGVFSRDGKKLRVVVVDPTDPLAKKHIDRLSAEGFLLTVSIISSLGIQKLWQKYKELLKPSEEQLGTVSILAMAAIFVAVVFQLNAAVIEFGNFQSGFTINAQVRALFLAAQAKGRKEGFQEKMGKILPDVIHSVAVIVLLYNKETII